MFSGITLFVFTCLLIKAAISDIKYYILSNKLCLTLLALYPLFILSLYLDGYNLTTSFLIYSAGIAVILFIILTTMFYFNLIGGGDVKMIPVVALWAGPGFIFEFLIIMTVSGGALSLIYLTQRSILSSKWIKSSENVNLSMSTSSNEKKEENYIPYGVAISLGGFYVVFKWYQTLELLF